MDTSWEVKKEHKRTNNLFVGEYVEDLRPKLRTTKKYWDDPDEEAVPVKEIAKPPKLSKISTPVIVLIETPELKARRLLDERRLVEDADAQNAADLFGTIPHVKSSTLNASSVILSPALKKRNNFM